MNVFRFIPIAITMLVVPVLCCGTTIDFEQFIDSEVLTTQIPGLTFSNSLVLTSGISLNELELPPHSGVNVASDSSGPIQIAFASPTTTFSGFFTYSVPLTLAGFNASGREVTSIDSLFSSNLALSGVAGSKPNEVLTISSSQGISEVTITGAANGGSFVMDDISFTSSSTIPEPSSAALLVTGLLAAIVSLLLGRR